MRPNRLASRVFVLLLPILAALPATGWGQSNVLSVQDTPAVAGDADVVIPIDLTVDQDLTGAFSFDVNFDPNLCNQLADPSGITVRKAGRPTLDPADNPIVCSDTTTTTTSSTTTSTTKPTTTTTSSTTTSSTTTTTMTTTTTTTTHAPTTTTTQASTTTTTTIPLGCSLSSPPTCGGSCSPGTTCQ